MAPTQIGLWLQVGYTGGLYRALSIFTTQSLKREFLQILNTVMYWNTKEDRIMLQRDLDELAVWGIEVANEN